MDRIPNALAEFFSRRATVRRYTGETPSRELIDSILEAAMRAPTTGNMQLYSVVETRDADAGYDNFLSFTSAMMDAVILTQQFVTLAELCGLGTCYLGTCLYNAPEIAELLKLPRLTVPVACISVGYPAEQPEATERLALDGVLYHETYPELTDTDIVRIYKAKDDFVPNAKFVAENGKKTLAQVFTDVRYPRAMNESVSAKLLAFLRRQGF